MDGGFPYLDIILFAMVAGFLILRLRSVLGRRTGNERPPSDRFSMKPDPRGEPAKPASPEALPAPEAANGTGSGAEGLAGGLAQIRAADPSFDPTSFLAGAKIAFEMILTAFAKGDEVKLKPLVSPEVFQHFRDALQALKAAGRSHETTLVAIGAADIAEARLDGRQARISVRFNSQQINVTRASDGTVVEGDPQTVSAITDLWTFVRDLRSRDPNWTLVATSSPA
jgi:predicted lipid-binding transport protein (Tim44 family)